MTDCSDRSPASATHNKDITPTSPSTTAMEQPSPMAERQLLSDTAPTPHTSITLHPLNTTQCHDTCLCFLLMHETHRGLSRVTCETPPNPVAPEGSPRTHQRTVNAELLDNQQTPNTSRHIKQDQQTSRFIKNGSPNNKCSILQMPSLTWHQRTRMEHLRPSDTSETHAPHKIDRKMFTKYIRRQLTLATKSRLASPGPDDIQTVSRQN